MTHSKTSLHNLAGEVVWAIDESWLTHWLTASEDQRQAAISRQRERAIARSSGGVAIIPVMGPISSRPDILEMLFGFGANTATISRSIKQAMADDTVKMVMLYMNTPGGTVEGVPELAREIYNLRGEKPIVAQVEYMSASAGYHLAAQADDIIAAPSSLIGSVGAFIQHMEFSGMLEQDGVNVEFIASNPEKVDGNRFEPLSDSARAEMRALVDDAWDRMVADIAQGRGVSANVVREEFGKGHVFTANEALRRNMIDKIRTLSETMQAFGVSGGSTNGRSRARAARELDLIDLK